MSHGGPLVTVGVATYNGASTIRRTLESIQEQAYGNLEVLIYDDGSTDETPQICLDFVNRNPSWTFAPNPGEPGMIGNYRSLLERAQGTYFCFVDQDDCRETTFISEAVARLQAADSAVGFVSTIAVVWSPDESRSSPALMHLNRVPLQLQSHRSVRRVAAMLRRYVDIWMYGVYRTGDMRRAFAAAPSTPIFPSVAILDLILSGTVLTSADPLIEYRAKGQARRTSVAEDSVRIGRRLQSGTRTPYVVQQAQEQARLAMSSPRLAPLNKALCVILIAADLTSSVVARLSYRIAGRMDRPPSWAVADRLAEWLHPHDYIEFEVDPVQSGYLAPDWRAH